MTYTIPPIPLGYVPAMKRVWLEIHNYSGSFALLVSVPEFYTRFSRGEPY